MAKQDDKYSAAEDYLAQLDRQSRQSPPYRAHRPWPSWASNEPKWKYQKGDGRQLPSSGAMRLIGLGALLLIGYSIFQAFLNGSDEAIYIGIAAIVAAIILFFAVRDASKSKNKDED